MLSRCLDRVDAFSFDSLIRALTEVRPQVVINGIGIIKQAPLAQDPFTSINVNALLPTGWPRFASWPGRA